MSLKNRIKETITKLSTYEDVAEKTGIGKSTLQRWAAGTTEPKISDILKIAEATKSDPITLAFGDLIETSNDKEITIISAMKEMGTDELETALKVIKSLSMTSRVKKELER